MSLLGLAAQGLSMLGQRRRNQRAMNQQMELMDHQFGNQQQLNQQQFLNQQQLNQQGHDLQYEMWKNTNAPAQVAMYREAGLNPALMYGMSGAGGTTTGSQGGGSASGGSAQGGNAPLQNPMDMHNIMMGLQLKKLKKENEGIDLQNESTKIDNAIKRGEDEAGRGQLEIKKAEKEIENLIAKKNVDKSLFKKYVKEEEILELERQMSEKDLNYLKDNNISREEWGILAGLKSGLQDIGEAGRWVINASDDDWWNLIMGDDADKKWDEINDDYKKTLWIDYKKQNPNNKK